jgi:hypothetical protein
VTEQTALVVALLGDSVVEIRRCDLYRIGVELPIAGAPPQTLVEPGRIHTSCYRHGHVTVHVTPIEAARPLARAVDFDPRWAAYLGLSLALHVVLWAFVAVVPPDDFSIGVDGAVPGTFSVAAQDEEAPGPFDVGDASDDESYVSGAICMCLPEDLRAGRRPAPDKVAASRAEAIAAARNAGVLGVIDRVGVSAPAPDYAAGFTGAQLYGGGGVPSGFGSERIGDGGSGFGTIVSGRYQTLVAGSATGEGWGVGTGVGRAFAREGLVPTVVMCGRPGCMLAIGDQDKAIIRRYLRRALPKIRYCYEKELLARPELIGDIATEFLIAADGHVTSSHAEGFDDTVASCVADVIGNIEFPRAARGGNTQVHYPFVFRPTG